MFELRTARLLLRDLSDRDGATIYEMGPDAKRDSIVSKKPASKPGRTFLWGHATKRYSTSKLTAEETMTDIPRPEYPRPNLRRPLWLNLNGEWRFAFDPGLIGEQSDWYRPSHSAEGQPVPAAKQRGKAKNLRITVPFPWESKLSGVERPDYKGAAWYEREFTAPTDWTGMTPFLNFGAIDWHARVWINGRFAAENDNGYLPFSIDLRPFVQPGETATVTVRAYDIADATTLVGKQVPRWYTCSSGIWQTVWLEGRAATHIVNVRVEPRVAEGQAAMRFILHVDAPGDYQLRVAALENGFEPVERELALAPGKTSVDLIVAIPEPQLWSPETPYLYEFTAELTPVSGGVPIGSRAILACARSVGQLGMASPTSTSCSTTSRSICAVRWTRPFIQTRCTPIHPTR
ncbi:MAG: hypothetical protein HC802_14250 [Caldilineaceae bacterium]|nr:hypothetical protein [Caldilineaceae bacterium]